MFSLLFVALILATLLAVSSLLGYLFKLELEHLLFLLTRVFAYCGPLVTNLTFALILALLYNTNSNCGIGH